MWYVLGGIGVVTTILMVVYDRFLAPRDRAGAPAASAVTTDIEGLQLMPKLTVEGAGTFDVAAGKRLVLAIEEARASTSCTPAAATPAARPAASSSSAASRRR